jgi:membrane associated rhomboid family serine protease
MTAVDDFSNPPPVVRPAAGVVSKSSRRELENNLMKPFTMAIIGALVVALVVIGYLYYQRTSNDITIQLPKVDLKR